MHMIFHALLRAVRNINNQEQERDEVGALSRRFLEGLGLRGGGDRLLVVGRPDGAYL